MPNAIIFSLALIRVVRILRFSLPLMVAVVTVCASAFAGADEANGQVGALRRDSTGYYLGKIVEYANGRLSVETDEGKIVRANVNPRSRIAVLKPADFSEIEEGTYIASTGRETDADSTEAFELRIVEDKLRGIGEGHRPYHGQEEDATMTNAKVVSVGQGDPPSILVRYRGKDLTIVVPDKAPVLHQTIGDQSALVVGAPVSLFTVRSKTGHTDVVRVNVGQDGIKPQF